MAAPVRALLPQRAGLVVPRLAGVEPRPALRSGGELRARLAIAMLDAGVADPALWRGDVQEFVAAAVQAFLARHGAAHIDRRFELHVFLDSHLDGFVDEAEITERLFLCVEPTSSGYVEMGAVLKKLERVHPRLPATIWGALRSLDYCVRLYDYRDVDDRLMDWPDSCDPQDEESAASLDARTPKTPTSLTRAALTDATARQIARAATPWARDVIGAALRLKRATARYHAREPYARSEQAREWFGDSGMPLPALLVTFETDDAISAMFDDEMQFAYEIPPEPNAVWEIAAPTRDAVARAFGHLEALLEALGAATDLIDALVGRTRFSYQPSLAEVLVPGFTRSTVMSASEQRIRLQGVA